MTDDEKLTLSEAMEFGVDCAEEEVTEFDGDLPNHAPELLASRSTDLLKTITNIEVQRAHEERDEPTEDDIQRSITEDLVDVLLAVAAVKYEYDLDVAGMFEERMNFIQDFQAMQEAMRDAESSQEVQQVVEKHMRQYENEDGSLPVDMGAIGGTQPGDNVDNEDYDHDDRNRSYA